MGTIEITLKEVNAQGVRGYKEFNVIAAVMEHDIGYLFMLKSNGDEVIQSMSEISSLEVSDIIIEQV